MKFLEVKLHNFMPYFGPHKLSLEVSNEHNVVLVWGDNMRGKTSLLNAIRFALFGRALGRRVRDIPYRNLVNRDAASTGDWSCGSTLLFEHEGRQFEIGRSLRLQSGVANPSSDSDFVKDVFLRVDGRSVAIERISHEMNQVMPEQVSRFYLFDAELLEEYENLVLDSGRQAEHIKADIERVLGVPALTNGRAELNSLLMEARRIQTNDAKHVRSLRKQAEELERLQAEKDSLDSKERVVQEKLQEANTDIRDIDESLEKLALAAETQIELEGIDGQLKNSTARLSELRARKTVLLKSSWSDLIQPRVRAGLARLTAEQEGLLSEIKDVGRLAKEVETTKTLVSSKACPVCSQEVSLKKLEEAAAELGKMEVELEHAEIDLSRLAEISTQLTRLSSVPAAGSLNQVAAIQSEVGGVLVSVSKLEARRQELLRDVDEHDSAEAQRLRARKDATNKLIGSMEKELEELHKELHDRDTRIGNLSNLMSRNPAVRTKVSSFRVETVRALEKVFQEGVDRLRDDLRKDVSRSASEAFLQLIREQSYSGLDINETYGLSILDETGAPVVERSAGAEQIVALSLIDGLNKTAGKQAPIVIDTPLARLDPVHRQRVLDYLPTMATQVVLLVHEGEIDSEQARDQLGEKISRVYRIRRGSTAMKSEFEQIDL